MTDSIVGVPPGLAEAEAPDAGSWSFIDLAEAAAAGPEPEPEWLSIAGGSHLLYSDKLHWIAAEPETGKTWLALAAVAEVVKCGESAVIIDNEDTARTAAHRLLALGVTTEQLQRHVYYVRPESALWTSDGHSPGATEWWASLDEVADDVALVVIDGVTDSMATHGLEANSGSDVGEWITSLINPIRTRTNAAVVVLDHVTKSSEGRGRWAIGSQHKMAASDVGLALTVVDPIARATPADVDGKSGLVRIRVTKDRPGHLRGNSTDNGQLAEMRVTGWPDGRVEIGFAPPGRSAIDNTAIQVDIVKLLIADGPLNKSEVEKHIDGRARTIRGSLTRLESEGYVDVQTSGNSHRCSVTDAGAEWYDQIS